VHAGLLLGSVSKKHGRRCFEVEQRTVTWIKGEVMSFSTELLPLDHGRIVVVSGRLDSASAGTFEHELLGLFQDSGARILIDFAGLEYISSAGLRVVLMGAKKARQTQSRMALCGLRPEVREVFEVSGFLKIIDVVADREAGRERLKA
jgi:anti-anti-sigma factor